MFFRRKAKKYTDRLILEWAPRPGPIRWWETRLCLEFDPDNAIFSIYSKRKMVHEQPVFKETRISDVCILSDGPGNVVRLTSTDNRHTVVIFDIVNGRPQVVWWRLESDVTLDYTAPVPSNLAHEVRRYLLFPLQGERVSEGAPDLTICRVVQNALVAEKRPPARPSTILNAALYDIPYLDGKTTLARIHDPSVTHTRYAVTSAVYQSIVRDGITGEWSRQLSFIHPPHTHLKASKWQGVTERIKPTSSR